MKTFIFTLLLFFVARCCLNGQTYYGVDGFAKMSFQNNGKFYFHYWDCGIDSGFYKKNNDTIYLTSDIPAIEVLHINSYPQGTFLVDFASHVEVYDSAGNLRQERVNSSFDSVYDNFKIENVIFSQSDLLVFSIFGAARRAEWSSDTIYSALIKTDRRNGRRIYFENYPLIVQGKFLTPKDQFANQRCKRINDIGFMTLKRGRRHKPYEVYNSGFGPIH